MGLVLKAGRYGSGVSSIASMLEKASQVRRLPAVLQRDSRIGPCVPLTGGRIRPILVLLDSCADTRRGLAILRVRRTRGEDLTQEKK